MDSIEVLCYNKGCGLKFDPSTNNKDCSYHPGEPIFHDAYKKWSCCNKGSTSFTTFLSIKGCVTGQHNPDKPKAEPKPKVSISNKTEDMVFSSPNAGINTPRISYDTPLVMLEVDVNKRLKDIMDSMNKEGVVKEMESDSNEIKCGESCKNNGCKVLYEDANVKQNECIYHPGVPMFHEGLKFWTCCQKRTCDFNSFLDQVGCSKGSHLWKTLTVTKKSCRYDWHQTGQYVFITIYAKNCQPSLSPVKANPIRIYAKIIFADNHTFEFDNELVGVVKPQESNVNMFPTKIEIKLRKADLQTWPDLFIRKVENAKSEASSMDTDVNVHAVDISDL